jgi:hypothetical protein
MKLKLGIPKGSIENASIDLFRRAGECHRALGRGVPSGPPGPYTAHSPRPGRKSRGRGIRYRSSPMRLLSARNPAEFRMRA